jgi:hypothetical protein
MDLGWKGLIPLALAWTLIVSSVIAWRWWSVPVIGALLIGGGLLFRAVRVGTYRSEAATVASGATVTAGAALSSGATGTSGDTLPSGNRGAR